MDASLCPFKLIVCYAVWKTSQIGILSRTWDFNTEPGNGLEAKTLRTNISSITIKKKKNVGELGRKSKIEIGFLFFFPNTW